MQITDGFHKFKAISGYVNFRDIAEVMNIHQSKAGVTPFASSHIDKHPLYGGTGCFVGFSGRFDEVDLSRLSELMIEMMVDGEYFKEEARE